MTKQMTCLTCIKPLLMQNIESNTSQTFGFILYTSLTAYYSILLKIVKVSNIFIHFLLSKSSTDNMYFNNLFYKFYHLKKLKIQIFHKLIHNLL